MIFNYDSRSFNLKKEYDTLYVRYSVTLLGGLLAWHRRFAFNKSNKLVDNDAYNESTDDNHHIDDIYQKYFSESRLKVHSDIERQRKRMKDNKKQLNRINSGYYKKLYIIGSVFLILGALLLTFGLWLVNSSDTDTLNDINFDDAHHSDIISDSSLEGSDS